LYHTPDIRRDNVILIFVQARDGLHEDQDGFQLSRHIGQGQERQEKGNRGGPTPSRNPRFLN